MAGLKLEHIYKVYEGGVKAVSDLNLEIEDKDFVVFVGPSGCGKSTTLRMIAGLEEITSGNLYIGDKLVNELPPKDRDISMVFQNYALYPHKTVYENMAFGLRLAHLPKEEIDARIQNAAEILGLKEYLTRKPKALSGGQRQRVALGRSIVREPRVFLLDEPLSNLDAKLRGQMRSEITKLHRRLNTTFIYVTHDQTEAMTMGSKIVVMKDGIVQQVDTPTNLYDHPNNVFVATFLGTPQMNIFNATIEEVDGRYYGVIKTDSSSYKIKFHDNTIKELVSTKYIGKDILLGIRPEEIYQCDDDKISDSGIPFIIDVIEKLGSEIVCHGQIEGTDIKLVAKLDGRKNINEGDKVYVTPHTTHIHLFDKDTTKRISGITSFNYFPAKLNYSKKNIDLNGLNITLSDDVLSRLLPEYRKDDEEVVLEIPTHQFKLEKVHDDDLELNVEIKTIEKSKESVLLFVNTLDMPNYIGVRLPIKEYKVGEKLKLYVALDAITLKNKTNTNHLIAKYPFTDNKFVAEVKPLKNNKSVIKFNSFKLVVDQVLDEGMYDLYIPYDAFIKCESKKDMIKDVNVNIKSVNESPLGENTILYANINGLQDYICIKGGEKDTCFQRNKHGYNIDLSKIELFKK